MTRIYNRLKELSKNNKLSIFLIMFFAIAIIIGAKATYAYYFSTDSASIIRSLIGDFDTGNGDINIVIYKENDSGLYVKSQFIPALGYELNNVSCTVPTCETTNNSSDCYYNYDNANNAVTLTSNQKLTCKFYFRQLGSADIKVYIMRENTKVVSDPKTYNLVNDVPLYGFRFTSASCDNDTPISYDPATRRFNVNTNGKSVCYAYFDSVGPADIIAHVYVQTAIGSSVYQEVESIPGNNEYVISNDVNHVSKCLDSSNNETTPPAIDAEGYLTISADEKVVCTVYLDIKTD